ncbi:MAG: hypothetical protein RIR62_1569 [Pseudomonadota bacterium]|jgi:uncharacterized protein (DUF4415 family)
MGKPKRVTLVPISDEEEAAINRGIALDPDSPEMTDEDFARLRPVWDFPELVEILQKHGKLGRPPLPEGARKERVTLHLDPDVLAALRKDGRGWQTRANAALRRALGLNG